MSVLLAVLLAIAQQPSPAAQPPPAPATATPRGGVILGRILDEFGEPLSDVQVAAMHYQFQQGRRQLVSTGRSASSDDMGEFRLYGITPGQYYLQATWRSNMGGAGNPNQTSY